MPLVFIDLGCVFIGEDIILFFWSIFWKINPYLFTLNDLNWIDSQIIISMLALANKIFLFCHCSQHITSVLWAESGNYRKTYFLQVPWTKISKDDQLKFRWSTVLTMIFIFTSLLFIWDGRTRIKIIPVMKSV